MRVAINGFGRMGRLAFREAFRTKSAEHCEIVHVNEPNCDVEMAAHLLEFDSVHGHWDRLIHTSNGHLAIGWRQVSYSQKTAPSEVDWRGLGIDLVVECSGKHKTAEKLEPYFAAGVKKAVVSAPMKSGARNIVIGVNDNLYDPERDQIVTAASCTTNCLAPVVKVVHEEFGIKHGMITTIHDVTNTQAVIDKPAKDFRRARSALLNLIPTTTGSATAIGSIFPELKGLLDGVAVRVPLLNASITDCIFELSRSATVEKLNASLKAASEGYLKGILGFEERPLVSSDYRGDRRSAIVDGLSTMVTGGTQAKIIAWYDNEVGYATRLWDLVGKVARCGADEARTSMPEGQHA
jgi:glyceraldehyde 3-phosphate dehydrogenase